MDLSNLGTIIRERREALGLTQSRLAQLSGLSRQTLVGLEAGALSDLGFNRVSQLLSVLGLDLDFTVGEIREDMLQQVKSSLVDGGAAMGGPVPRGGYASHGQGKGAAYGW